MKEYIMLTCPNCSNKFMKYVALYNRNLRRTAKTYCSKKCYNVVQNKRKLVNCLQCSKSFIKKHSEIIKSPNHFCSHSCAAIYGNSHKITGTRRSKLEQFIESSIRTTFPGLTIVCNSKQEIGSELDFYFPTLKLAIEINGVFHYEPIFGKDKLTKIQNNDKSKLRACDEKGIDLIIIPTIDKYMSKTIKEKYLDSIINIIESRI